jgi:hypothetical protein
LFVGSGVIEAGCKTVLGRLKQSGMFWTVRGANLDYSRKGTKVERRRNFFGWRASV